VCHDLGKRWWNQYRDMAELHGIRAKCLDICIILHCIQRVTVPQFPSAGVCDWHGPATVQYCIVSRLIYASHTHHSLGELLHGGALCELRCYALSVQVQQPLIISTSSFQFLYALSVQVQQPLIISIASLQFLLSLLCLGAPWSPVAAYGLAMH
jgi:hypothetical protein